MNTAAEILLIIVSSVLALFLIVAIIAVIKVIQILHNVRHITEQAEKIADSAEAVGEFFSKNAGPIALGKFVANIAETVVRHKKHKEK
jgi:hypothetical protein